MVDCLFFEFLAFPLNFYLSVFAAPDVLEVYVIKTPSIMSQKASWRRKASPTELVLCCPVVVVDLLFRSCWYFPVLEQHILGLGFINL